MYLEKNISHLIKVLFLRVSEVISFEMPILSSSLLACQLTSFIPPALHLSNFVCDLGILQHNFHPVIDTVFLLGDVHFCNQFASYLNWIVGCSSVNQIEIDPY